LERDAKAEAYRVYMTDTVKYIAEATAFLCGGRYTQKRYYDFIHPKPEETRTSEEIVDHFKEKLKRLGGE
jgi:hypothetical protein